MTDVEAALTTMSSFLLKMADELATMTRIVADINDRLMVLEARVYEPGMA